MLAQFAHTWPVDDLAGQYLENHFGYTKKKVRYVIHKVGFQLITIVSLLRRYEF